MIDIHRLSLCSPRITIRKIDETDLEDLYQAYANPNVMKFTSDPPFTSFEMMKQFYSSVERGYQTQEYFELAVVSHEKRVVGTCSIHSIRRANLSAEVGYLLAEEYWGHGMMTEAVAMLVQYCFECLGFVTIYADVDLENIASRALLAKVGFNPVEGDDTLFQITLPALKIKMG